MAAGEERRKNALVLQPIRRLQRRLNRAVWLKTLVVPAWCAVTSVALSRLLNGEWRWAAAAVLVGLAGAWWMTRARKARVSFGSAAVIADRSAEAGGLLLTRLEL